MRRERYSILLVDDEEDLLDICQEFFEAQFEVYTASNGLSALEILREKHIDIVISDSLMPTMDGHELLIESRKLPNPPLFFMSTGQVDINPDEMIRKGATGVISKPFRLQDLSQQLFDVMGKLAKK